MDFSCIYRLQCKDKEVKEFYIGSTKDFIERRYKHKNKSKKSNYKFYKFIRENGGWENWEMIVILELPNKTEEERLEMEEIYLMLLKPPVNKKKRTKGIDKVNEKESELFFMKFNEKRHNIFGLWSTDLIDQLEKDLENGSRKVENWANNIGVKIINMSFEKEDPFFNINTKEDLKKANKILDD